MSSGGGLYLLAVLALFGAVTALMYTLFAAGVDYLERRSRRLRKRDYRVVDLTRERFKGMK